MDKPTAKQQAFAETLGIDIPDGATKQDLSELIDHALLRERQEEHGLTHVTAEVALATVGRRADERTLAYLTNMARLIRETGVRPGDVVRYRFDRNDGHRVEGLTAILVAADAKCLKLCLADLSRAIQMAPALRGDRLLLETVYRPVEGFRHPSLILAEKSPFSRQGVQAFVESIEPGLAAHDRYTNEHATFWRTSAAWEACAALERSRQETKLAATVRPVRVARYCVACGADGVRANRRTKSTHRCANCSNVTGRSAALPLAGRHCIFCNAVFTAKGGSGNRCECCSD